MVVTILIGVSIIAALLLIVLVAELYIHRAVTWRAAEERA